MSKPGPGKFQANDSLEIAEALYAATPFALDSFGDSSSGLGWYGLIPKDMITGLDEDVDVAYIVEEDTSGFFTYEEFPSSVLAKARFEELRLEKDVEVETV